MDWEIEEIQLFNDHALVIVTESIVLVNRQNNDDTSRISGAHLAILVKIETDDWKLKTDVSSLDHPVFVD